MAINGSTTDPFTAMWAEWVKWATPPGGAPPSPTAEATQAMRRMFFDILAGQADQFMRSELFLNSMKQAMDNAMAWQKMINDALQQGLAAAQMPSRADNDHLVTLVRGMEDRLDRKLDDLLNRVEQLERRQQQQPAAKAGPG